VRRKIKPIGADYALTQAGISFGKDCLSRHQAPACALFKSSNFNLAARRHRAAKSKLKRR